MATSDMSTLGTKKDLPIDRQVSVCSNIVGLLGLNQRKEQLVELGLSNW